MIKWIGNMSITELDNANCKVKSSDWQDIAEYSPLSTPVYIKVLRGYQRGMKSVTIEPNKDEAEWLKSKGYTIKNGEMEL